MDSVVDDASSAILDFELHRLHYTYSMVDFETFREDYRYVYRNRGSVPHSAAPLLWRSRAVQANMYVLDASNSNLVYLPSEMTRSATQLSIAALLQKGHAKVASQEQSPQVLSDAPTSAEIEDALAFESPRSTRDLAYSKAMALSRRFPDVQEFSKTASLLQFALEYYLPLALLPEAIKPGQLAFLRHGVDIYLPLEPAGPKAEYHPLGDRLGRLVFNTLYSLLSRQTKRWRLGRLFVGRRYDFDVPLALDAVDVVGARSLHLRVTIPPGLRVVRPIELRPSEVFEDEDLLRFASFDESNVYLYLGRSEIQSILKRRDAIKAKRAAALAKPKSTPQPDQIAGVRRKFTRPTVIKWLLDFLLGFRDAILERMEGESKVTMNLHVPLSLARGIRPLIAFLWIPTAIMAVAAYYRVLSLDLFVSALSVLFVVVLTTGIFAIDRRVLRDLVLAHAMLALAAGFGAYVLSLVF